MKLVANCKACRAAIPIKQSAVDRVDLIKEMGERFDLACTTCTAENNYSSVDVVAKEKKTTAIIGFVVLLFGTATILYLMSGFLLTPGSPVNFIAFGGVLLIPAAFYRSLIGTEIANVRRFNQYRA